MVKLSGLAQPAIDAAGGLNNWRQFETVSTHLLNDGAKAIRCSEEVLKCPKESIIIAAASLALWP
ncbi:MAG TPA: hypothetical protein VF735_03120 [Pyrinomonadaceae bacterium]|jgi:predicted nucleotidyltransferase